MTEEDKEAITAAFLKAGAAPVWLGLGLGVVEVSEDDNPSYARVPHPGSGGTAMFTNSPSLGGFRPWPPIDTLLYFDEQHGGQPMGEMTLKASPRIGMMPVSLNPGDTLTVLLLEEA